MRLVMLRGGSWLYWLLRLRQRHIVSYERQGLQLIHFECPRHGLKTISRPLTDSRTLTMFWEKTRYDLPQLKPRYDIALLAYQSALFLTDQTFRPILPLPSRCLPTPFIRKIPHRIKCRSSLNASWNVCRTMRHCSRDSELQTTSYAEDTGHGCQYGHLASSFVLRDV